MNNGVKKAICIASTVTMCGLYTLPIYAINEKDTMYCKANNIGAQGNTYRSVVLFTS